MGKWALHCIFVARNEKNNKSSKVCRLHIETVNCIGERCVALWAQHTQALEKFALNSSRGERRTTVSVPNTTPKWMDVWMVVRARKRHCTDENYDYFEYTHSGTHFSKIDLKCVRNYAFMLLFLFVSFGKYLCNRRSAIIRSR